LKKSIQYQRPPLALAMRVSESYLYQRKQFIKD